MGHAMDSLENLASILPWDQWPRPTRGEITQQPDTMKLIIPNLQRGSRTGYLSFRAEPLSGGQTVEVGNFRWGNQGNHRRPGESISHRILLPGHMLHI
jgi:hypothetical protein